MRIRQNGTKGRIQQRQGQISSSVTVDAAILIAVTELG
jgi:hypothetical protein